MCCKLEWKNYVKSITQDIKSAFRLQHYKTSIIENSPLQAKVRVELVISETSSLVQDICVFAHLPYIVFEVKVNWNESHKFLKVSFILHFKTPVNNVIFQKVRFFQTAGLLWKQMFLSGGVSS